MLNYEMETAARVLFGIVGLGLFLHYSAMAGYLGRAPRWVVVPLLAFLVGDGVLLIGCAIAGNTLLGVIAMAAATPALLGLYLAGFVEGLHMSEVFEKQAVERDRKRMRYYLGEAINGYEYVAQDLSDSRMDQLQQSGKERMRA